MPLTKPRIYVGSNGHDLLYSIRMTNPDQGNLILTEFCVNFVNDRKAGLAKVFIKDHKISFYRKSRNDAGIVKEELYSYPVEQWVIDGFEDEINHAKFKTLEKESGFKITFNEF